MKTRTAISCFAGGLLFGALLILSLGATPETPKKEPAQLQVISYPVGTTGFFDPATGRLYIYDNNLANCILIREITTLGAPMNRLRN